MINRKNDRIYYLTYTYKQKLAKNNKCYRLKKLEYTEK